MYPNRYCEGFEIAETKEKETSEYYIQRKKMRLYQKKASFYVFDNFLILKEGSFLTLYQPITLQNLARKVFRMFDLRADRYLNH